MNRVRITEASVAELANTLSAREQAIVVSLDCLRVATTNQLARLHFAEEGSPATIARRARRTLHRLLALRVLARLERRIGGSLPGSSDYPYALDVAGQRLASVCGPAGGARLRRPWTPGAPFLRHALAVTELSVRLTEAERTGALELLAFEAEPRCWRTYAGIGGARLVLKPDAHLRLGLGEFEAFYFIEVDRATQSRPAIKNKLTVYRRYFATGREQDRYGVFPRVLFLVPHQRRQSALAELIASQGAAELCSVARFADALDVLTTREDS